MDLPILARPFGGGPDGLGASVRTYPAPMQQQPMQQHPVPQEAITQYYPQDLQQLGYELPFEPKDVSSSAAVQSAGFTALFAAVAIGVGVATAGPVGGAAGLMLAGAVANGYRAQKWMNEQDPQRRHEAMVSATFAVGEVVLGGYLAYKAYKSKKEAKKA